ncbi:Hypp7648 [Branchiostoma lanceolatum]|uniref:Hypp7648 protein n=1 Tax=Branchiostoma lanceolatum TaxID=7740 RepID=A0A8J9Z1U2_BRALA|nr:Hypp7648 [Branchiostoma lanceolatum]
MDLKGLLQKFTLSMMAPGFPSLSDSLVLLGCLFIVTESGAQTPVVTVTNSGNVDVFRTETANLSCSFVSTVDLTVFSVSWYKLNEDGTPGPPFLVYVTNSPINENANRLTELGLTDRVSFLPDLTSITIHETAQPDTGTFRCEVNPIFPGGGVAASVDTNLTVVELTTTTAGQVNTDHLPDGSCFGAGTVAGAAVGCHVAGMLLGIAVTLLVLRSRNAQKDAPHDEGYEDVRTPNRAASQHPGTGNDDYEIPMEA